MAEFEVGEAEIVATLVEVHHNGCEDETCPAKGWDAEKQASQLMLLGLRKGLHTIIHGPDGDTLRVMTTLPEAIEMFYVAIRYELEQAASESESE